MKLALVADWLPTFGGAEHVLYELSSVWPDAPIFTTIANRKNLGPLADKQISTSRLQKWYTLLRRHEVLLPWMPKVMEGIDLEGYDVVISSSHAVAKGIVPPSTTKHICYCHTPMRYAWEMEAEYLHDFRIPSFLHNTIRAKLRSLRRWDLTTAKRVDVFVANSSATQERIARTYNRESIVVPPPVSDHFFDYDLNQAPQERRSFLAIGRMVPYKKFDLLIETANQKQLDLTIVGTGPEEDRLRKLAGPTVQFLGYVSDEELPKIYASSRALLFPQIEDAGVVPLEAQACGTPVIALGKGGILDTVKEGETGIFFKEQSCDSLAGALDRFASMQFDSHNIKAHAQQYSATQFRKRMKGLVDQV